MRNSEFGISSELGVRNSELARNAGGTSDLNVGIARSAGTPIGSAGLMRSDLKQRTKQFALEVLRLSAQLRPESPGWLLRSQLVRAGTGVGSNYRAACRGKSLSDFISKLTTAEEEADETSYWLELLIGCEALPVERVRALLDEASELTAIFVCSIKTAKKNRS